MVSLSYLSVIFLWRGLAQSKLSRLPSRTLLHQPRHSPTPDEAAINVKRALAEGRHVFGRDVCDDAFPGEGAVKNICTPSPAYCCERMSQSYPQCQNFIGKGWCCVQGSDNEPFCYVDQKSVCDEVGSVPCSGLAARVSQACCPQWTVCQTGYNFTEAFVRCEIHSTALESLARAALLSAASTSSTASSTPVVTTAVITISSKSSESIASSAPQSNTTATSPGSSLNALSGGAIAGIAVGPTMALLVGVGLWFLYTRRQKKKRLETPYHTAYQQEPASSYQDGLRPVQTASPPTGPVPYKYHHQADTPQELPGHNEHELEARDDGRL